MAGKIQCGWQSCDAAARRLGRNVGHIRRVCMQRWHAEGIARWVTGGGKKGHYEVRRDATLKFRNSGADLEPLPPAAAAAAGVAITININAPVRVTINAGTIIIEAGD